MSTGRRRDSAIAGALVAVIWLAAMAPLLFGARTLAGENHASETLVWHQEAAQSVADGSLPTWFRGSGLGAPMAAVPNQAAMYPPVWVGALQPGSRVVDWLISIHMLVFALGICAWSRRLGAGPIGAAVAGAASVAAGGLLEVAFMAGPVYALAYVPWLGWACDAMAATFVAKDAQARSRRVLYALLLALFAGAAGLSGPSGVVVVGTLVAAGAVFGRAPGRVGAWMVLAMAGLIAMPLAAMAWFPAWAHGAVDVTTTAGVQGFSMWDLGLVLVVLAIMPGMPVWPAGRLLCLALVCVALAAVIEPLRPSMCMAARVIGWTIAGVGISRLLSVPLLRHRAGTAVAVVLMVAGPTARLWTDGQTMDRSLVDVPPSILQNVEAIGTRPMRLAWPGTAVGPYHDAPPLSAARFAVSYMPGPAVIDRDLVKLWRKSSGAAERLLDMFAVDLLMVPRTVAKPAGLAVIGETLDSQWVLAENTVRRSRAFVAQTWSWHEDADQLAEHMFPVAPDQRHSLAMASVRLLGDGPLADEFDGPVPSPPCDLLVDRSAQVIMKCDSRGGGYAVLLDRFAPGWSAWVDDRPATIERADLLARAVALEPGEHRVEFRYRLPGLKSAAIVSALTWLSTFLALVVLIARRRRLGHKSRSD